MSTYTDSSDIVFLNDKNIVHNLTTDKTNAIASLTLVSALSDTVSNTYVSAENAAMNNATAENLTVNVALSAVSAIANDVNISSLTVDNLTANGKIQASLLDITGAAGTVNVANVRANTISAATISASELIIVDGKLTATNDGLTANGKLSTSSDLVVAGNLSVSTNLLTANSLTVDNAGVHTPGLSTTNLSVSNLSASSLSAASISGTAVSANSLSATALSANDLSVTKLSANTLSGTTVSANSLSATTLSATDLTAISGVFSSGGIRIGDNVTTNKILIDNDELKIIVPLDNGDPKLNINGKRFTEYYEGYLSDGYLEDIDIVLPDSGEYTHISCLKFTWNDDSGNGTKLIPLSALGGIYDVADGDTIIKIVKTNANSFKVSADETAISSLIKDALSAEFGIQDTKNELSNKIKFRNGENVSALTSLTIRKTTAAEYNTLGQADKDADDVIYVINENDMEMFGSRITNLGAPSVATDAATKGYVDDEISALSSFSTEAATTLSGELTALINTTSAETYTSATAYTDEVSGTLQENINNKILLINGDEPTKNIETLTVRKMTADAYKLLTEDQKNLSNVIYSITDPEHNMFGNRIVELGTPTESADAATKKYVDDTTTTAINALSSNLKFVKNTESNTIELRSEDGNSKLAEFEYSDFVKDGFLSSVRIVKDAGAALSVLRFVWKAADGTPIPTDVELTSIASLYSEGQYIDIVGTTDANIKEIKVDIDQLSSAISEPIRKEIIASNLTVLNNHDSTTGTWNAPAAYSPLALLSGAISNVIKADVISEDNRISAALSDTVASTYISVSEMANYAPASISTTVADNYVSSSTLTLYRTTTDQDIEDNRISTALSAAVSSTYVSATALAQDATDGDGVFNAYAKKAEYVSKDELCNNTTGVLTAYYTKAELTGNATGENGIVYTRNQLTGGDGLTGVLNSIYAPIDISTTISSNFVSSDELTAYVTKDALSDGDSSYISTLMNNYYTAASANETFETIEHVEQLITNISTGVNDISNGIAIINDDELDGTTNDISVLSGKINDIISAMNTIISVLSGISKFAPAP